MRVPTIGCLASTFIYHVTVKYHPEQNFVSEDLAVVENKVAQFEQIGWSCNVERLTRFELHETASEATRKAINLSLAPVEIDASLFAETYETHRPETDQEIIDRGGDVPEISQGEAEELYAAEEAEMFEAERSGK